MTSALLMLDLQNDFMPGGALGVPGADQIVPMANRLQPDFDVVAASQNWHPPNHVSFAARYPGKKPGDRVEIHGHHRLLWPPHCIAGTPGAEFAADLRLDRVHVLRKGTRADLEAYSAFFDRDRARDTGLLALLEAHDVREVYLLGVAVETCVRNTAQDALELGYRTCIIRDGVRALEAHPDADRVLEALEKQGARVVYSGTVVGRFEPRAWH